MAGKRLEADRARDPEAENVYSSTDIKLSNMFGKRNNVYVEGLSATNANKSEDFRTALRRLRNDGYTERRSAINTLIRSKIFKLSAVWGRITRD